MWTRLRRPETRRPAGGIRSGCLVSAEARAIKMPDLGTRVATSVAWMVGLRILVRGIGLVSTLILARLLVPDDFGLIALAVMLQQIGDMLGNFNFGVALIANQ